MKSTHPSSLLLALFLLSGITMSLGAGSHKTLKAPGFRPQSKLADSFLEKLGSSRIVVLPTLVRTRQGTAHSEASQKAIVHFLKENKLGVPELREIELDLGVPKGKAQYDLFQNGIKKIGNVVKKQSGADYFLVLEQLITPTPSGDIAMGGIHVYVLDGKGKNAFSFLLNSHHEIFVKAKLRSSDSSKQGRDALVLHATEVALVALDGQIKEALKNKSR